MFCDRDVKRGLEIPFFMAVIRECINLENKFVQQEAL